MKTKQVIIPAYGDNVIGDALIDMSIQCLACDNLNNNMTTCKAFPKGIPEKILVGHWDHIISFRDKKYNDNGILFKRIEE